MPCIPMPDLSDNGFKEFTCELNGKSYTVTVRWNVYNECAFCQIKYNGEELLEDEYPLVCYGVIDIDRRKLPKLIFGRLDRQVLPPTKESFSSYGFFYNVD